MMERRKGTIQRQRINTTLLNPDFQIDDRSFDDLLAYIVSYLEQINYFTTENVIDGNWRALVEQDPVIFIIGIVKEPIDSLRIDSYSLAEKINVLLNWYRKIEHWYHTLLYFKEPILADKISNVLLDVLEHKKQLLENVIAHNQDNGNFDNSDFDVDEVTHTFRKMIVYIQNFTREYLQKTIFSKNNHMPNNAMYITFALLFKKIQDQINKLGQRHLDFYYKDVLQQTPRKGIPTKTVVYFEVLPNSKEILIPENTELIAGKLFNRKKNVLFRTEKPLLTYPIRVNTLQTLYFNKSPFIKIGTNDATISNIVKNNLVLNEKVAKEIENYSIFGADENSIVDSELSENSLTDIGFMIGSKALFLEEGERNIQLTFNLQQESSEVTFWKLLKEMATNLNLPLDVVFNSVFEEAFIISYTTTKKWRTQKKYELSFNEEDNSFSLHFIIEKSTPPVAPLASEASKLPMVKILLDEYAPIYAYSFLKGLQLETIQIEVSVTGAKNLAVYNNIGKMPLTKPFNLFGTSPQIGNYLLIGKSELFKKELSELILNIEWDQVPMEYGGFETYYSAYTERFFNDSFRIDISALSNGYWFPREEERRTQLSLFKSNAAKTPEGYDTVLIDKNTKVIVDNLKKYQLTKNYKLQDPIAYDIHTNSGFFKFTFTTPKYGFGNDVYQKNYVEIATHNARNEDTLPLPNKPFIPKVKQLTLNYTASDTIYFNNTYDGSPEDIVGDYIHITPFGIEKIVNNSKVFKNSIVADFKGEGYLFLKLSKAIPSSTVSLFFDLNNRFPEHIHYNNNILIEYEVLDRWIPLPKKNIISDGTDQLTKSGIIEILLPHAYKDEEKGEFSLRFIAKKEAYKYPIINAIHPNAVVASCTSDDENIIGKQIAANSITKMAKKMPNLKKVIQPKNSYGGKLPTSSALFYTEVSERLRHKDRALTIWDYERLVLSYFHDVRVVKCTNLNALFKPQAGKVTLLVLSSKWRYDQHHYFNRNELDSIYDFIKSKANSFIKIKVQNPVIEWLLVTCIATFEAKDQGGYYLNALNKEINEYLCPVSQKDNNGLNNVVVPRMLKSHLENLPYIESIQKIDIEHIIKKGLDNFSAKIYEENNEIKPSKPWSMLVPKMKHNIYSSGILEDETIEEIETQNLQIGVDYIIAGDYEDEEEEKTVNKNEVVVVKEEKTPEKTTTALSLQKAKTILTFKTE